MICETDVDVSVGSFRPTTQKPKEELEILLAHILEQGFGADDREQQRREKDKLEA
jgi:hypothetical protein